MTRKFLITSFAIAASISLAHSQKTPRTEIRQEIQKTRIKEGVQNGELTARETRTLAKTQRKTARMEKRVKSDGKVTKMETVRLEAQQDRNSRKIARKKNNKRDRN